MLQLYSAVLRTSVIYLLIIRTRNIFAMENFYRVMIWPWLSKTNFIIMLSLITAFLQQGCCDNSRPNADVDATITISAITRDMHVTVDGIGFFNISSSKPVEDPLVVYLSSDDTHIATVSPTATIKSGDDSVEVDVRTIQIGSCTIEAFNYTISENQSRTSDVFVRVHVRRSHMLGLLTGVFRWFYEFCFVIHLLPQFYLNYQRKSVVGLSFDYLLLSLITFFTFATFNIGSYASTDVREADLNSDPQAPGVDLINLADVLNSVTNLVVICAICAQCYRYEKGDQHVSIIAKVLLVIIKFAIALFFIIMLASQFKAISFVTFIDIMGYLKLLLSFSKYIPQVHMNYERKSTEGWSIAVVILDLLCGALTVSGMFIVAFNYGHWISFIHSPTRLGIALFSIIFSTIFIIQHYVIYRIISEEDTIPIIGAEDGENKTLQASDGDEDGKETRDQEMKMLQGKGE
ncbi:cystinosin homolog isoform X1 [Amphiura filiformis]|uniref:cystinosin homolog isoform X1 n=1 Tax=Amphiura filiformis TaxID=82378 RepID=UPI003B211CDA